MSTTYSETRLTAMTNVRELWPSLTPEQTALMAEYVSTGTVPPTPDDVQAHSDGVEAIARKLAQLLGKDILRYTAHATECRGMAVQLAAAYRSAILAE